MTFKVLHVPAGGALSVRDPGTQFDLVTTHYAHPAMPQLAFYDRIASWVAPGGTLLIVGHLPAHNAAGDGHGHSPGDDQGHGHGHQPPVEVSATVLDPQMPRNNRPGSWAAA